MGVAQLSCSRTGSYPKPLEDGWVVAISLFPPAIRVMVATAGSAG